MQYEVEDRVNIAGIKTINCKMTRQKSGEIILNSSNYSVKESRSFSCDPNAIDHKLNLSFKWISSGNLVNLMIYFVVRFTT